MTDAQPSINLRCPAKLNLALSVGPPDATGMHPICSWMVAIGFSDELTVSQAKEGSRFEIAFAAQAPQPAPIDWPVEKDLIYRAHQLIEQKVGRSLPVHAVLRKRIPIGAGLGGGSSDAAGMLLAVDRLYGLRLPPEELAALAGRLGSDVAFFLGAPSAVVTGTGSRIAAAPLEKSLFMTLILPPLHCNTAAVYRTFDQLHPDATLHSFGPKDKAARVLMNDLTDAACTVQPALRKLRDRCRFVTGKTAHVTGSGAALYIPHQDLNEAARCATRITEHCQVPALPVTTLASDRCIAC